jgi:hypothetical protein
MLTLPESAIQSLKVARREIMEVDKRLAATTDRLCIQTRLVDRDEAIVPLVSIDARVTAAQAILRGVIDDIAKMTT